MEEGRRALRRKYIFLKLHVDENIQSSIVEMN